MSRNKGIESEYSVNHTDQLYDRFFNLAINRFEWEGLPSGLESRKIEEYLIMNGRVMFFKDTDGVLKCLPAHGTRCYDIYNEPIWYQLTGNNYNKTIDRDEGVIIRNNAIGSNDHDDLLLFAQRINEVEQTMDVNLFGQLTPYVILCDEKERLTFKNIMLQVKKFKYAIFGSKKLAMNNVDVLQTKSEYLIDKLQLQKTELMNELLTFLGINNNNVQKKERMLVDEVNANNDFILVNIDHMYDERKRACEEINKKYGLSISVKKREVEASGTLHSGIENTNKGQL